MIEGVDIIEKGIHGHGRVRCHQVITGVGLVELEFQGKTGIAIIEKMKIEITIGQEI